MPRRRVPKAIFPFVPDCTAEVIGESIPARYLGRHRDTLAIAYVQTAEGVFTTAIVNLKALNPPAE